MRSTRRCLLWLLPCALLGALVVHASSSLANAPSGAIGRYQAAAVGSRGPQRFGTAFRLDTTNGKSWRAVIRAGRVEGWQPILEPEGEAPRLTGAAGRYRLSAELISDTLGQESAVAVRIDTQTGASWFLRPLPPPASWVAIQESGSTTPGGD